MLKLNKHIIFLSLNSGKKEFPECWDAEIGKPGYIWISPFAGKFKIQGILINPPSLISEQLIFTRS
jgi:hypothetical protein